MRDTTVPDALLRAHRRATRLRIVGQSGIDSWWIAGLTEEEPRLNRINVVRNSDGSYTVGYFDGREINDPSHHRDPEDAARALLGYVEAPRGLGAFGAEHR